jgi:hypothetical protein
VLHGLLGKSGFNALSWRDRIRVDLNGPVWRYMSVFVSREKQTIQENLLHPSPFFAVLSFFFFFNFYSVSILFLYGMVSLGLAYDASLNESSGE